ncbi:MAG TPA: DinB family protein [Steroidobacteraceae bacterium]|nr:DinB family protein [Steroidobacteraceae bacterium]
MQYLRLSTAERSALCDALARMPRELEALFGPLGAAEARERRGGLAFSPVEQVWHLADLEQEGFGRRIERLRHEANPHLADFDGDAIAAARDYRSRSMRAGLAAFAAARAANLARLAQLAPAEWELRGTQEGVGAVALCDLPVFMGQHDAAHRAEIEAWRAAAPAI